jgi:hypothetical protein
MSRAPGIETKQQSASCLIQRTVFVAAAALLPQVAMAVGFIDPEPREKVRPPRKQVLVVVTASLQVLAFDHNLALMWEVAIAESMPRNAHLAEVSGSTCTLQCGAWLAAAVTFVALSSITVNAQILNPDILPLDVLITCQCKYVASSQVTEPHSCHGLRQMIRHCRFLRVCRSPSPSPHTKCTRAAEASW